MRWTESLCLFFGSFVTAPLFGLRLLCRFYALRLDLNRQAMLGEGLVWLKKQDISCLRRMEELLGEADLSLPSSQEALLALHELQLKELVETRKNYLSRLLAKEISSSPGMSDSGKEE